MKVKKGIMALEGAEETLIVEDTPDDGVPLDEAMVQGSEDDAAFSETSDALGEAQAIDQTLATVQGGLEAAVASGEGVGESEAAMVNATLEHFAQRLSYTGPRRPRISLEGMDDTTKRLANTQAALEDLKHFRTVLQRGLQIAQEGFWANLRNNFAYFFSTRTKMKKELQLALQAFNAGTPKTEPINEPGWGRMLNPKDASTVDGADVIALAKSLTRDGSEIFKLVNEMVKPLEELIEAYDSNRRFDNDSSLVSRVRDQARKIEELAEKIERARPLARKGEDATFTPLTAQEGKQLGTIVQELLDNREMGNAASHLNDLNFDLVGKVVRNEFNDDYGNTYIQAKNSGDHRSASAASHEVEDAFETAWSITRKAVKVAFSSIKYIKASTGPKAD